MIEQIDVPMGEADLDDIAERPRAVDQKVEAAFAEVRQIAAKPGPFWTIRHAQLSHVPDPSPRMSAAIPWGLCYE